jgi:hypothetical protein
VEGITRAADFQRMPDIFTAAIYFAGADLITNHIIYDKEERRTPGHLTILQKFRTTPLRGSKRGGLNSIYFPEKQKDSLPDATAGDKFFQAAPALWGVG